jgi:hypothetical protein
MKLLSCADGAQQLRPLAHTSRRLLQYVLLLIGTMQQLSRCGRDIGDVEAALEIIGRCSAMVAITFTHSLKFGDVLCFLRRASMLRAAARDARGDAQRYARWPERAAFWGACAADGELRASSIERIVRAIQPLPKASATVAEFVDSVINPRRSGRDLAAFADHVERTGMVGLEHAAKFGFRRPPETSHIPRPVQTKAVATS